MTDKEAREIILTEWECVDRQDTPKCDRDCRHCDLVMDTELVREAYRMATKALEQQQKTGHWIRQTDNYHDYYECEQCGIAVGLDDIKNYCPNCGCRMKGEGE